jgi:putative photosynthetic complex assembly protein
MMSHAAADRTVPKGALLGAAALVAFSIVTAGVGRLTGIGAVHSEFAAPLRSVPLRFEDRADGGISVIAPNSGAIIGVVPVGTDGFVRTALRSLAFDRERRGVGHGPAFLINKWPDGETTLDDPATGRRVTLGAFGDANLKAFTNLMTMGEGKS